MQRVARIITQEDLLVEGPLPAYQQILGTGIEAMGWAEGASVACLGWYAGLMDLPPVNR